MPMRRLALAALLLAAATAGLPACESGPAINKDMRTTFLTADDLVQMTDRMASSIASDPEVAAIARTKPLIIVMKPMINDTNEIIRGTEKEMYVHRVRALLASKQVLRNQFTFVLNRDAYNILQAKEGLSESELGPVEGRIVPEYALKAHFYADTKASSKQRSDYYLCTYQLTNINTGAILWEDTYETKKSIKREMLD